MQRIQLPIVTSRPSDIGELDEILRDTCWDLAAITLAEDASTVLKAAAVPILLFDRDAAGESWQAMLRALLKARRNACVVLLSSVSDQYLWDELVQHGGFDLLTRPFRNEQVLSVLMFAHAHCRTPWPKAIR